MALRRVLALLLSIALVTAAYFVWDGRRENKVTTTNGSTQGTVTTVDDKAPVTILCIPEVEAACRAASTATGVAVTIEEAGTTVERLKGGTTAPTVWVTLAPWPDLLSNAQARAVKSEAPVVETLAFTPVVVAGLSERVTALQGACAPLTWTCIGDKVETTWASIGGQESWRDVELVHDDPTVSASGLAAMAAALAGRAGTAEFGTAELGATDISAWIRKFEATNSGREVDAFGKLSSRSAFYLAAGLRSEAGRNTTVVPTPEVSATAVAAGFSAEIPAKFVAALKAELGKNGWTEGVGAGMPDVIAMEATQRVWASEKK